MWASRWDTLFCLLCLLCPSPTNGCTTWHDLQPREIKKLPHTIDVRAKNSRDGYLFITLVPKNNNRSEEIIQSSSHYSVYLFCTDYYKCGYKMQKDSNCMMNKTFLKTDFEKFRVEGDNLEFCDRDDKPEGDGEDNKCEGNSDEDKPEGDGEENKSEGDGEDDKPEIWVLALVAVGVAVTVASISVLVWSLCRACKSEHKLDGAGGTE